MADRLVGKNVTVTISGLGANSKYVAEVDTLTVTNTADSVTTWPLMAKKQHIQITGDKTTVAMDGGMAGALFLSLAGQRNKAVRAGSTPDALRLQCSFTMEGTAYTIDCQDGTLNTSDLKIGMGNALTTQSCQIDFDILDVTP